MLYINNVSDCVIEISKNIMFVITQCPTPGNADRQGLET